MSELKTAENTTIEELVGLVTTGAKALLAAYRARCDERELAEIDAGLAAGGQIATTCWQGGDGVWRVRATLVHAPGVEPAAVELFELPRDFEDVSAPGMH